MKHTFYLRAVIALIALFSVSNVSAQKLHSISSSTNADNIMVVCYDISGLGNVSSVTLTLRYTVTVSGECFNPGKRTESVPAHDNVITEPGLSTDVPVKNGRATGCINSGPITAGSCPNPNWNAEVTDASYTNVTLSVLKRNFNVPSPQ